jgi:hypothetical protein
VIDRLGVRAVVIGVERYAGGSDWDLDGPASDAARFAAHLVAADVPPENIALHVAPLERNEHVPAQLAPEVQVRSAAKDTVRASLTTELAATSSSLLLVHWGAHGLVTRHDERVLLCPEATAEDKQNLNLSRLLRFLRTEPFSGHRRQLIIVDACAEDEHLQQWNYTLPDDGFPVGPEPREVDQQCLWAAVLGDC